MGERIDFESLARPLASYQSDPLPDLIEGLVSHPTLLLLYAPSGGMKSLFALDLARSVATGREFLGYQCQQKSVLYVDGEMSNRSIWMRAKEMGITEVSEEQLCYLTPQDESLDFDRKSVRNGFIEFVDQREFDLVVFDNLRVLMNLADENDATSFTVFNDFVRQLRGMDVSVLLIHHANKSGEEYAGSSNIVTVYDGVIGLSGSASDDFKQVAIKKVRDQVGLHKLDGQYVSYSPEGFKLNDHAGIDLESVVNELVVSIRTKKTKTVNECRQFLRDKGVSINNTGWSLKRLFDEYVHPYSTGGGYRTLQDLKNALGRAKEVRGEEF